MQQYPTSHLPSLKLIEKFKDVTDNEYQFATQHHAAENTNEFEQMNVLNELVTRIRAEDAGSVSALVVSKKEDTRFGKTVSWAEKLETAFGWIAAITIFLSLTALIRSLIGCEKRASISTKEVTLKLQAWRLRQRLRLQQLRTQNENKVIEPLETDVEIIADP